VRFEERQRARLVAQILKTAVLPRRQPDLKASRSTQPSDSKQPERRREEKSVAGDRDNVMTKALATSGGEVGRRPKDQPLSSGRDCVPCAGGVTLPHAQ